MTCRQRDRAHAQADQHQRHAELEHIGDRRRHLRAKHDEGGADNNEGSGVADAPAETQPRGAEPILLPAHHRRHGGQMIGLEGVAHAEQRSEAGTGNEFDDWHNWRARLFYVNILLIAIGGAIGSVGRHFLSAFMFRLTDSFFPFGIFAVNVLGCASLASSSARPSSACRCPSTHGRSCLVGVLGGFTTFSTYAFDSVSLMRDEQWSLALLNMMGQVVVGVAALWGGMLLAR